MNRFSARVVSWPLARRNSQLLSALAAYRLPFVNSSWSLLADFLQPVTYFIGRSARAPSRRFAFVAFDLLICAGVEAGPG